MIKNYILIQLKHVFSYYRTIMLTTVALFVFAGLFFVIFYQSESEKNKTDEYIIGLVGDTSDPLIDTTLYVLEHADSLGAVVHFEKMSEKEADRLLRRGKLTGYALIPDDYAGQLMRGINTSMTYVTGAKNEDLISMLLKEFIEELSNVYFESEKGIFALQQYIEDKEDLEHYYEYADELNMLYFVLLFERDNIFETVNIVDMPTVTIVQSVGFGVVIFFILLFGIVAVPLYVRGQMSRGGLLGSKGCSALYQILAEYISYIVLLLSTVFPILVIAELAIGKVVMGAGEMKLLGTFFADILIIVSLSAVSLFLYECCSQLVEGALLQLIMAMIFAFLGGCLLPISFFPILYSKVAFLSPGGAAHSCLIAASQGDIDIGSVSVLLVYIPLFIGITCMIRNRRIEHG